MKLVLRLAVLHLALSGVYLWAAEGVVAAAAGGATSVAAVDSGAASSAGAVSENAAQSSASRTSGGESAEVDSQRRDSDQKRVEPKPRSAVGEQGTALQEIQDAILVFRQETERQGARGEPGSGRRTRAAAGARWHGRVYEYIRNNAFDAVPHQVVQNGGDQNILRRNQFGFSVSGPVVIPKVYDGGRSTFFTFSYEGTREKVGRSFLQSLPTLPQRQGDFSDLVSSAGALVTVYDPASTRANPGYDASQDVSTSNLEFERDPFANNQIPMSRQDPVAQAVAAYYPEPNTNIGPFLQNNYFSNPTERNSPDGFIGRVDHSLFERHKLTVDTAWSKGFGGEPNVYGTAGNPGRPDREFLDRRLVVRETYAASPNAVYDVSLQARSRQSESVGLADDRNFPRELGLGGVNGAVFPTLRLSGFYGLGAPGGSYRRNANHSYEMEHSLSLRRGKHQWTFTGQVTRYQLNTLELDSPSGELSFNRQLSGLPGINNTGSSFASMLLGMASQATVSDQPHPSYFRRTVYDTTVRDEIELTDNLTANWSLSLDVETPRTEKYDRQSTIDLNAINPANGLPGALIFAGRSGRASGFQPVRTRLEPRVGLAWSPTSKRNTVLRATFMHYYADIGLRDGAFGTQGFNGFRNPISPNRQLSPAVTLSQGFAPLDNPLPDLRGDAANDTTADLILDTAAQPRLNYLSFQFEQRLAGGLLLRAASRSYRGANMLAGGSVAGFNRIPLEALAYRDRLNDESFRRTLRPYPQFQRFNGGGQLPIGRYLYDSGDFSVEKRTGEGLSFDVGYQYRRRYDDYSGPGVQNPFDRTTAWAASRGNRPHRLSMSYMYELPFGDGKALLNRPGVFSKVFGGWSLSGFTSWLSGDPITLSPEFNNTGGVVPYLRVNQVPGVDPHVDNPGPGQWFNPLAFAHPDDFEIGNVSRSHPTLRNPNWQNHDLAVTKRLPLSAEKSLELLFQGFNFVNHANWNDPDAEIGLEGARNVNAGRIIGSRGGRVLQLGARYNF